MLGQCFPWGNLGAVELPFQDPTPAMLAAQARDAHRAEVLALVCGGAGLIALAFGMWLLVQDRRMLRARARAQQSIG